MYKTPQAPTGSKDPKAIARKYQLELCRRAVKENIIVCLETGSGKTHIAVLLIHELGNLIRRPSKQVCVFLAPTVALVCQQTIVIENSTDFKVQSYFGSRKHLKDHDEWSKIVEESEVLVMTPQILLQKLRHCFIRMDMIALLIFDECHHAQLQTRHPYKEIMKEFYNANSSKHPRIFGMTASPSIGKGGIDPLNYTKCINSLENLLDAKVCSVDDKTELESIVASPDIKVYCYGPVATSSLISNYCKLLKEIIDQCMPEVTENKSELSDRQKKQKLLWKIYADLVFCLENIGLFGVMQAVRVLLTSERFDMLELEMDTNNGETCVAYQYLNKAASVIDCKKLEECNGCDPVALETIEEPLFSRKLILLIKILSTYRDNENRKCIIFVKRIILARALVYILGSIKSLDFWRCEFLVGLSSGLKNMSRKSMTAIIEKFSSGQVNLLVATNVAEEGLDIQTCCLVVRFDLPETVASFIQSRGRARMLKSEYILLVESGNQHEEKLLKEFVSGEETMNKEIQCRTSTDTFNDLEEKCYRVDSTGASISSGYSVSLLYHYCSKLSRDIYFTTTPNFFYLDVTDGTICRVILPSNAPLREVDSQPFPSKDEAKRDACFNACIQLHKLGALTDYLLPHSCDEKKKEPEMDHHKCDSSEDELREELHDMLVPSALKVSWTSFPNVLKLYFYIIKLVPNPEDRDYRTFGLFTKDRLPEEAEAMEVELRLAHGRTVQTSLRPVGVVTFDKEEILLAHNFQEMYLKVILDRSELVCDYVTLGGNDATQYESSTFYFMLPVQKQKYGESMAVDWETLKCCLSSPIFGCSSNSHEESYVPVTEDTLILSDGPKSKSDIMNSLVYVPHSELFFFVDGILDDLNAYSQYPSPKAPTYAEHYKKRFDIDLSHPEQPFLKAKQVFMLHNLLHSRAVEHTDHIKRSEIPQLNEHFVELPPELCQIKILGFSKDIGSTLSLLPSLMHRLEHLLTAIELKDVLSASFPEGSQIRADCILEALTTEKCMERRSLERFEVLGDAFLKYTVGRHIFLSYEGLDEGELTRKRSRLVNNSNLYELAIKKNLQVYLCDELFDPFQYFALGRPCRAVCDVDTETSIHGQRGNGANEDAVTINAKCTKSHRWLHMKTIADVVESLVGAYLVESGFKAAISFLRWIGIKVDFDVSNVYRVIKESKINMTLSEITDVDSLEESLGYKFTHRSLLLQALVHPSYHKHSVGCYQELEFLGDAVLEYLITSYLFSAYPDLKPGQLTDLRSMTVGNNSFAHIAVWQSFHKHLIKDSNSLTDAINKFECFVNQADSEGDLPEEPACPKVLGDIVESCFGAVLLDTGFDLTQVWRLMLKLLEPVLGFSTVQFNPVRVVRELCQRHNLDLGLPDPVEVRGGYFVKVEVKVKDQHFTFSATNHNSKAARRMAAQEAVSKLKTLGYKHKKINKSLEEILRATRKKEAKLVGFNEEPIDVKDAYADSISPEEKIQKEERRLTGFVEEPIDIKFVDADLILLQKLQIREAEEVPPKSCLRRTEKKIHIQESERIPPKSRPLPNTETASSSDHQHSLASRPVRNPKDVITEEERIFAKKTARSQLFEICTANHWSPPQFICCKVEGPSHLKVFTYRATLQMTTGMLMECYSEPHLTKKTAQEHAAEGVLWCLKHLGYLHNH